ncbi:SDR family NAD(P)-dependent oxidoreductase [Streptomyces sp. YIM 98790]|uniref:SDR family NAD(P)-dependent oxidoreductase n=1 Tax=Streptomyces sp. YIM 98790 TaxID=2689077 RepID=UPI00140DF91E|nr:SDR family NAD(P)-dependent oxidoreductase [Streptomyces sp. YIM 98790]
MNDSLVWISGASSGIGAALARHVPFDNARITGISRSPGPPNGAHLRADLADPRSWAEVEDRFRSDLAGFRGSRAVFVHCASTLEPVGFAGAADSAAYRSGVLLNSAAPQALGHAFLAAGAGLDCARHLLLISSGLASRPAEGVSGYCAGKAALDQWVRTAGAEQRRARGGGCRILAVNPGAVDTPMQARIRASDDRDFPEAGQFRRRHASGALADPDQVARAIWDLLAQDHPSGEVVDVRRR